MDINQFSQFIFTECITFTEHKGENKKRTWLLLTNPYIPVQSPRRVWGTLELTVEIHYCNRRGAKLSSGLPSQCWVGWLKGSRNPWSDHFHHTGNKGLS